MNRWAPALLILGACGAAPPPPPPAPVEIARPTVAPASSATLAAQDACEKGAETIYVLDDAARIHAFEPDARPEDRFRLVTTARCDDATTPQTMSLDREGTAWLLYTSGKLHRMKLPDGRCVGTSYVHPDGGGVLGMSFTAAPGGGAGPERLYISGAPGLIEVELPKLTARVLGPMPIGELAGGPDGLLFHFEAESGILAEVDPTKVSRTPVHTLTGTADGAFTVLRHRRGFVFFVAPHGAASRVFRWSPRVEQAIDLGPAPDGIRLVGRAQSVCVDWRPEPPPPPR